MSEPINETSIHIQEAEKLVDLAKARMDIIDSVLSRGLLPKSFLEQTQISHLGSMDESNPGLKFRTGSVESASLYDGDNGYEDTLYDSAFAVLPVICERGYGNHYRKRTQPEEEKRVIEERAAASFVVVFEGSNMMTGVPLANIRFFIFPESIYKQYTIVKGGGIQTSIPIIVVTNSIERRIRGSRPVTVPNYEAALKTTEKILTKDNKRRVTDFRIHGVRLPTTEDLKHIQADRQSI